MEGVISRFWNVEEDTAREYGNGSLRRATPNTEPAGIQ
jgi:hypothetical protein